MTFSANAELTKWSVFKEEEEEKEEEEKEETF